MCFDQTNLTPVLEGSILTEGNQFSPPLCGTKEPVQKQLGQQPVAQSWLQRMCSDQNKLHTRVGGWGFHSYWGQSVFTATVLRGTKELLIKDHPSTPLYPFFSFLFLNRSLPISMEVSMSEDNPCFKTFMSNIFFSCFHGNKPLTEDHTCFFF